MFERYTLINLSHCPLPSQFPTNLPHPRSRSRKPPRNASNMAKRRLFPPRPLQRQLRKSNVKHKSKDISPPRKNRPLFPVSSPCHAMPSHYNLPIRNIYVSTYANEHPSLSFQARRFRIRSREYETWCWAAGGVSIYLGPLGWRAG